MYNIGWTRVVVICVHSRTNEKIFNRHKDKIDFKVSSVLQHFVRVVSPSLLRISKVPNIVL